MSLFVGAPSETPLRHHHLQVQRRLLRLSRLRGTSTEGLALMSSAACATRELIEIN